MVVAFLLTLGGFACIVLSMPRHCRQVWGSDPARRGALTWRIQGWVLLVVALVLCIVLEGPSVGIVAWTGVLTVAALVVTMLLTYRPRIVSVVACAAPLLAVLIYWRLPM